MRRLLESREPESGKAPPPFPTVAFFPKILRGEWWGILL